MLLLNQTGLGLGSKADPWDFFLPKDIPSPAVTALPSCDLAGIFPFFAHLLSKD